MHLDAQTSVWDAFVHFGLLKVESMIHHRDVLLFNLEVSADAMRETMLGDSLMDEDFQSMISTWKEDLAVADDGTQVETWKDEDYMRSWRSLVNPTPATHAFLAQLKAGEPLYQAGELPKTLRVSKIHYEPPKTMCKAPFASVFPSSMEDGDGTRSRS